MTQQGMTLEEALQRPVVHGTTRWKKRTRIEKMKSSATRWFFRTKK